MRFVIILLILSILFFGCTMPEGSPPSATPTPASEPTPLPIPDPEPQPAPKPLEQPQLPPEKPIEPKTPQPQPTPTEKPKIEPPFVPPQPPPPQFEEVTPGKGAGTGLGGDNGPWKHRIKSASAKDGLTWTKDNFVLADQASVPDALVDNNGDIRVYYVDWKNRGVTAAINANNAWKYYRVKIMPAGFFDGADPDVILVDNKYRVYFTKFDSPGSPTASINIAFSDNGIEFQGEKIAYPKEERVTDPDVFIANKWIMLISKGQQNAIATSSDGLNFQKQGEVPFTGSVSNTIKIAGGYRMYYHKSSGMPPKASIYSAFSSDGLNWQEEGLRLEASASEESVESPAVVKLSDGTYKMFYHSMIND